MKFLSAVLGIVLCFPGFALSAFEVSEANAVRKGNLEFSTVFLRKNWESVPVSDKTFRKDSDSRKTPAEYFLSGKWTLPDGDFLLKHSLTKEDENTLKLSLRADALKNGISGRVVMISTTFPILEFGRRTILVDGKSISFPEKFDPGKKFSQGKCLKMEIPLQTGTLFLEGPFWYRLQDNRAYSSSNWSLRIYSSQKVENGLIQSARLNLVFRFVPYASTPLPLTGAANSGFTDETPDDRKGGWTDQGSENDFRTFPQDQRIFAGVPFRILKEKEHPGRSCIVLRGKARSYFPKRAELNLKNPVRGKYLYLLHCVAWPTHDVEKIGTVAVESASAEFVEKEIVRHDIRCQEDVGNFWDPAPLKNARVGWKGRNAARSIGLYVSRIPLNGAAIRKIEFESAGKSVWMIVGATVSDIELSFDPPRRTVMKADRDFMELKETDVLRHVEPGSILDFSGQLDAPAGKYGFLKNVNGHFEFEKRPGIPVRFYGVNIAQGLHFMTDENMDRMVEHIAATGYNLVRFHHFDGSLAKPTKEDPLAFDPVRLERLDMLVKKFREKGIYITVDLYTCRKIGKGEIPGVPDDLATSSYKGLLFVHPPAMENFLRYMRKLLTHRNRYTGLTWAEDPAICKISLINEDSITHVHKKNRFLLGLYQRKFEEYKRNKGPAVSGQNREQIWSQFLVDTYDAAFRRLRAACTELKIKAPVTDQNFYTDIGTSLSREQYDYVDNHFYNNHPVFIGPKSWSPPIRSATGFMLENHTGNLLSMARSRLLDKPFTVSEWDFVNPNPFVVEGAFETGAYAASQGWSSLERFCYGFGEYAMKTSPSIHTFSMITDPLRLLSERAGVLFFLRGDVQESKRVYPILLPRDYFRKNRADTPSNLLNRLAMLGKTGLVLCDSVRTAELPPGTVHAVSLDNTVPDTARISRVPQAVRKWNLDRTRFLNDTGEIALDADRGTFLVQTEKSEAFLLKEGSGLQGRFASVDNRRSFCAVLLSAMDGKPLRKTERFLILHLTRTVNKGMTFRTQDGSVLEQWSAKPSNLLFQRGEAVLTLPRELTGFRLYALNLAGRRLKELPVRTGNGKTVLPLKTDHDGKVVAAYELVRDPASR